MRNHTTFLLFVLLVFASLGGYFYLEGKKGQQDLTDTYDTVSQLQELTRVQGAQIEKLQKDFEKQAAENRVLNKDVLKFHELVKRLQSEKDSLEAEMRRISKAQPVNMNPASRQPAPAEFKPLEDILRKRLEGKETSITSGAEGVIVSIPSRLLFGAGSGELLPEAKPLLGLIAGVSTNVSIRAACHTDTVTITGELAKKFPSTWELSAVRAAAVTRHLQMEGRIPPSQMSATGMADALPLAPNDTEVNRAKNRRVEITLVPFTTEPAAASNPALTPPLPGS